MNKKVYVIVISINKAACVFDGCMQELKQLRASYGILSEKNKKQYEQFTKTSASLSEANKVGLIQLFHAWPKLIQLKHRHYL